ncbi:MAG: hypothetical protein QXU98_07450 [Candidatus Parvarchaeota archaeon]
MRGIYTYKITLSNTTSTATPAGLQVRLNINFASLVSNINTDLGNIRFSSDQAGNNLLYAWLESAPQGTFTQSSSVSSYTSSNVWVNLGNNIIPANGLLNIYMQILSIGTEFDGVYWGANPLWTSTYGQYDNGANVFNNYWNFAGTSLPSSWQEPQTAGVTINNGVSFAPGSAIGYIETTAKYPIGEFTEANFNVSTIGYGGLMLSVDINGNAYTANDWVYVGTASGGMYNGIEEDLRSTSSSASVLSGSYTITNSFNTLGSFIGSITATSTEFYIYKNYNTLVGDTTTNIPPQGNYYIVIGGGGNGVVFSINWLRTRTYPPNGTDPVLTSITLLVGNYVSSSIPVSEWKILKGKPYVTVSAKGISNGLSNIPNDGADFGPDTLLGASSPNQYGPPYTQTSGIQEAWNYALANPINYSPASSLYYIPEIKLIGGAYDIYAPITISPNVLTFGGVNYTLGNVIMSGWGSMNPYLINHVTTDYMITVTPDNIKNSNIEFNSMQFLCAAGVTAYGHLKADFSTANSFVNPFQSINLDVNGGTSHPPLYINYVSDIQLYNYELYNNESATSPGSLFTANDTFTAYGSAFNGDSIYAQNVIAINGSKINFAATSQYGLIIPTGYNGNIPISKVSITNSFLVFPIQIGINIGHMSINNNTLRANTSATALLIAQSNTTPTINKLSMKGNSTYLYQNGNALSPLQSGITIEQFDFDQMIGNTTLFSKILPTPSIAANPPVTATVYQNQNPFDIRIYLPAYATTSGTAGSVAIALGSSSSPSTIGTKYINGSTSSSATEIIELVVPAGWYYEFTATGVTFGTATVLPA